jgi:hypothetical protein
VAVGGETTIPNKGVPESVLFKNGALLDPRTDYSLDYNTGVITLTVAATAGQRFQLVNFSTYHISDTYTKAQIDAITLFSTFVTATNASPVALTTAATVVDMDCSAGNAYATLPAVPKSGVVYRFRDKLATVSTVNRFTVKRNGGTGTIMGIAEDMEVTQPRASFGMMWNGSDWRVF